MSGIIQRRRGLVTRGATSRRAILLQCSLRKPNALQSREERNRGPEKACKLSENVADEPKRFTVPETKHEVGARSVGSETVIGIGPAVPFPEGADSWM